MALWVNIEKMRELMSDFHTLSGISLSLFDEDYHRILSVPDDANFCARMRQIPLFDANCRFGCEESFRQCRETHRVQIFRCHAGLKEAAAPIIGNDRIIGYLMFGQVSDAGDRDLFFSQMTGICAEYGVREEMDDLIRQICFRDDRRLLAAYKFLDVLIRYSLMKEVVHTSGQNLMDSIDLFLEAHIREDISVEWICREFNICRTSLYELFGRYTDGGVAAYIKNKRLEYARKRILTTDDPIPDVAEAAGFTDYNYFLRLFKQKYGISSRKLRKKRDQD